MASKNDIITLPHPNLRTKSQKVTAITDEIKQIISDMEAATLDWEASRPHEVGVALAAVQIDKLYRIVVIRNNFDDKNDRSFVTLINPEIVKKEGVEEVDHEGCLSIKDVYGMVKRASKVRIKALDIEGREIRLKLEGFIARVLQHEIDHTNGVMFIDHITDEKGFFKLDDEGKLVPLDYKTIKNLGILKDENND